MAKDTATPGTPRVGFGRHQQRLGALLWQEQGTLQDDGGYKSMEGMNNGIALAQWLYSGEDERDLAKEMAA